MKVILNERVQKVGYKGDVVNVKEGFFRNYLFPRKLASAATNGTVELAAKRREKMVLEKEKLLENVKEAVKKLKGLKLEIAAKVTGKDTLYAAVSEADVIDAVMAASNILLEKKFVKFDEPIKTLGKHTVTVDFGNENTVEIKLTVVKAK
jgi:large subunit ribosomal protein L9